MTVMQYFANKGDAVLDVDQPGLLAALLGYHPTNGNWLNVFSVNDGGATGDMILAIPLGNENTPFLVGLYANGVEVPVAKCVRLIISDAPGDSTPASNAEAGIFAALRLFVGQNG